jgi:hypothetical protein
MILFFVDLGGIFDLGDAPRASGKSVDGLKCLNVSTIALQIDIATLQKNSSTCKCCGQHPGSKLCNWCLGKRKQAKDQDIK